MPIFFLVVGLLFLVAVIRGKDATDQLIRLLKADFSGPNNFLLWAVSIGGIAAIGYVRQARQFSNLFLALVFIVLIFTKKASDGKDLISSFISQVQSTEATT